MNVYPVNYSAGLLSTGEGADDLRNHLSEVASSCPNTKFVIGGYSMGATVVDDVAGNPPPDVASRIRGIATFGNIDRRGGGMTSPLAGRWIDQCNPGDPVCQEGGRSGPRTQATNRPTCPRKRRLSWQASLEKARTGTCGPVTSCCDHASAGHEGRRCPE